MVMNWGVGYVGVDVGVGHVEDSGLRWSELRWSGYVGVGSDRWSGLHVRGVGYAGLGYNRVLPRASFRSPASPGTQPVLTYVTV